MLCASVSLVVGLAIAGAAAASSGSGAVAEASRTLDRTYRCPYAVGCTRVSGSVSLSSRGFASGGRASQFGDRYQRPAPRTVLVRVRVAFARSASVGQRTRMPVKAGAMAVRTASGKRIAYADADESGLVGVIAASSCVPE